MEEGVVNDGEVVEVGNEGWVVNGEEVLVVVEA